MKKILHITGSMNQGGIENLLMNIFREIDRDKISFDFLVSTKNNYFEEEIRNLGGEIYYITPRRVNYIKNKKELDYFFKNNKYTIVHQHASSLTYIEPLKKARKYNVENRIIHSHNTKQGGNRIHEIIHLINKINIKNVATEYFTCSNAAGKWMYPSSIYNDNKHYKIVYNGINPLKFEFNSKVRNSLRNEFNFEEKDLVIGHVGRFTLQKNHNYILDIFQEVLKIKPHTKLVLIGDGKLRKNIQEKANNLGIDKNIIFLGERNDVKNLIQMLDVFLMPSFHEGLPVVLVEAQASGLSCVISKEITSEIKLSENVMQVGLEEPMEKWVNEILRLYYSNLDRSTGKKIIEDNGYDIKNVAKQLERFYMNLN